MKEGTLIRFLIVALPAGLLLLGVASMVTTHLNRPGDSFDPNEEKRLAAAGINRKPVNRDDLERYLFTLVDTIGERNFQKPEQLERAAVWIESTLSGGNIGYRVQRQEYHAEGQDFRNLIAELPGTSLRDEIVVVGAHYDSVVGCPGANDNGSGIAALLSLARSFAGDSQERTVRFVAFVNEEPPFFHTDNMGSRQYARQCRENGDRIVAMMSLDVIGYFSEEEGSQQSPDLPGSSFPTVGNFLAFVGNEDSRYSVDSARTAFMQASEMPALAVALPETVPGVAWSDHWSFWQEDYPGIMVTDTAPYRYPHYHKPTDTADKVDLDKLLIVTRGLESVIRTWANP